jgi:hypothetical protein
VDQRALRRLLHRLLLLRHRLEYGEGGSDVLTELEYRLQDLLKHPTIHGVQLRSSNPAKNRGSNSNCQDPDEFDQIRQAAVMRDGGKRA